MRWGTVLAAAAVAVMVDAVWAETMPAKGNADYPPEALAKREQGAVLVDLTVGTNGHILKCAVLVSSGSQALDQQTCTVFRTQARFNSALGERGRPSHARGKITWVIPGCPAPVQTDSRLRDQVPASATITSLEPC
jgi:TonB family protein